MEVYYEMFRLVLPAQAAATHNHIAKEIARAHDGLLILHKTNDEAYAVNTEAISAFCQYWQSSDTIKYN